VNVPSVLLRIPLEGPVEIVVEGADEGEQRRAIDWAWNRYRDLMRHVLAIRRREQRHWATHPELAGQVTIDHPASRHFGRTIEWVAEHDDSEPHYLLWYLDKGLDEHLRTAIETFLAHERPELLR
jgi:hypothetical protein